MEPQGEGSGYSKSSLWVAWVSSFFAAGSGTLIILVLFGDFREWLHRRYSNGTSFEEGGAGAIQKRQYLSSSQAKHVAHNYTSILNANSKELSEWVCSICLEDNEPGTEIRTILLPCSHRFHRQYVTVAGAHSVAGSCELY